MTKAGKPEGKCRVCGANGPLTFEHIPPQAAFNDCPVVLHKWEEYEKGIGEGIYQKYGRGDYVLCEKCNNNTGGAYGAAFAQWCRAGFERIHDVRGRKTCRYVGVIQPARVLKQLAVMFAATIGDEFASRNPDFVKFILDKNETSLPTKYGFHVFWYGGGGLRQTGLMASLKLDTSKQTNLAEIVHPPFGYVLTLDSTLQDSRPEDISFFSRYAVDEFVEFNRAFPVLETHWMMAGDYRTLEQIAADRTKNQLAMRNSA